MSADATRPEFVKCVGHSHVDLKGTSWCGRDVRHEWAFVDAAHAAENGRQGGRLVACVACTAAISAALATGQEPSRRTTLLSAVRDYAAFVDICERLRGDGWSDAERERCEADRASALARLRSLAQENGT